MVSKQVLPAKCKSSSLELGGTLSASLSRITNCYGVLHVSCSDVTGAPMSEILLIAPLLISILGMMSTDSEQLQAKVKCD